MMEKPVTTPPQFWPFPSDGIPQTFHNFNVVGLVHCGAFRKVLVVDNTTSIKKNCEQRLDFGSNLAGFFESGGCFARPLLRLDLCFHVITINP